MQDPPHPPEILQAVSAFLRDVVVPSAAPGVAYQARVAAAALDLIGREWVLGPAAEAAELAGLVGLLGQVDGVLEGRAELARRLGAGELTISSPGVAAQLRATVLAKLAIDQPRYHGVAAAQDEAS
jgi:hypothetical protein